VKPRPPRETRETAPWHVVNEDEVLINFCTNYTQRSCAPVMDPVVTINEEMQLNVFIKLVRLNKIGDHQLPASISSTLASISSTMTYWMLFKL